MADQLLFRGGNTASVAGSTVSSREIVIDTETNQIVLGSQKDRTVMEQGDTNRVGIGTSSPSAKLDVRDSGTNATIQVSRDGASTPGSIQLASGDNANYIQSVGSKDFTIATNSTEKLRLDRTGKLLLGTSSSGAYGNAEGLFQVVGESTAHMALARSSNNDLEGSFTFAKSRGTTASPVIVNDDDRIGRVRFAAYDGTDYNSRVAEISAHVDGTPGVDDTPGRLIFSTTAPGAASPSTRLLINSDGNVGIGVVSPTEKLQVSGTIKATNINFTGLSTYASDAAAGSGGLTAGDVYKTATGELRIKL